MEELSPSHTLPKQNQSSKARAQGEPQETLGKRPFLTEPTCGIRLAVLAIRFQVHVECMHAMPLPEPTIYRLPPKKDHHVYIARSTYHYAYYTHDRRKSIGEKETKKRKEGQGKERKDKKAEKRKRKGKKIKGNGSISRREVGREYIHVPDGTRHC